MKTLGLLGAAIVALIVSRASAAITVNVSGISAQRFITQIGPSTWDVHCFVGPGGSGSFIFTTTSPGLDKLRYVTIESKNPGFSTVLLIGTSLSRFKSVDSIALLSGAENQQGWTAVGGVFLSENLGPVTTHRLLSVDVSGSLTGGILLVPHATQTCSLDIPRVAGNVLGDIYVSDSATGAKGEIFNLLVDGKIGSTVTPVTITVGKRIERLRCGELNAVIFGTGSGADAYLDWIQQVETTTANGQTGIFRGDLFTRDIANSGVGNFFKTAGDLLGTVHLGDAHSGSLNTIEVPASGLKGRIVINELASGSSWTAPVTVGGTALSPTPAYTATAASLGGGSVGLVPFRLHATDCTPVSGASVPRASAPAPGSPIRMRHYGPVAIPAGLGSPFIVERRSPDGLYPWTDETACFTQQVDASNNTIVNLTPSRTLQAGFQYRVRLAMSGGANILRCDLPSGTATSVADHAAEYSFTVVPVCPGDANNDGMVDFTDVTTVLSNYGITTCLKLGDANRDGMVTFADVTAVYTNWLTACGSGSGEGLLAAGGGTSPGAGLSEALKQLGFESLDAFITHIAALPDDEARLKELAELASLMSGGGNDR